MTSEIIEERMIIIRMMMIRSDHRHKRPIEKFHHFHCVHFYEFPKKNLEQVHLMMMMMMNR